MAAYDAGAALATLEVLTGGKEEQGLLEALIEQAEAQFRDYCHREDVPEGAESVIVRMAQHLHSQAGSAGLASQSYSGAGETFLTDYPSDLKRALNRYRRLVTA